MNSQLDDLGPVPNGAREDPDNPGWYSWGDFPRGSFAAATGRLLFRPNGDKRAQTRIVPTEYMLNNGGSIHGGAIMSFIDMSMFAGGHCAGIKPGHYVTLDLHVHFANRTRVGSPLDCDIQLVRQTPGGIAFFNGTCTQDGESTHGFSGTLKLVKPRG